MQLMMESRGYLLSRPIRTTEAFQYSFLNEALRLILEIDHGAPSLFENRLVGKRLKYHHRLRMSR